MADFTALKTAIQTYIKQNGNEEITGNILQEVLLSVVTTLGDGAINDLITALANEVTARQQADGTLQQNITNEATTRGNADTALQGLINGITGNIENGYVYAGIATPSSTPTTGKVFYLALTAGTYTNFGSTEVSQGINILKYNGSAWSLDAFIGIDDELTAGSNNLPKSGNVLENIIKNGSAFDLSAYNAVDGVLATYADLGAALTALNSLPAVYKQGGMSMKFVLTSDNKYVQYRLMSDTFNTTPANWQGVDEEPTPWSKNFVQSGGVFEDVNISNEEEGFDSFSFTAGKYIDYSGELVTYEGAKYTDLIPVSAGTVITASVAVISNLSVAIAFYNSSKVFELNNSLYKSEGAPGFVITASGVLNISENGYIRIAKQIDFSENDTITISTPKPVTIAIKELDEKINDVKEEQDEKIDEIKANTIYNHVYNGLDNYNFTNGKYIDYSGELVTYVGAKYTDFIPVLAGTVITASVAVISNLSVAIAFYNSSKVFELNNSLYKSEGAPGFVITASGVLNISENGYIRIAKQIDFSENDTITIVEPASKFIPYNQWNGKKWYCFGTSLTDNDYPNAEDNDNPTGRYSNELARLSGLIQYNHGVAGGRIATSEIYEPTAHIYNEIFGTDFSDADLITLEGFVNDVTASIPIGTIGSKDRTTLIGALSLCIEHFLQNSDALVILLTSTFGKPYVVGSDLYETYYGITYKNAIGLSIKDYNDAINQVANYYCIPCIETGAEAMINEFHPEFIIDQIHHSIEGGKRFAQVVWDKLKTMSPLV